MKTGWSGALKKNRTSLEMEGSWSKPLNDASLLVRKMEDVGEKEACVTHGRMLKIGPMYLGSMKVGGKKGSERNEERGKTEGAREGGRKQERQARK